MKALVLSLLWLLISSATPAQANLLQGHVAIHIAKTHYLHPVRLLHPYMVVWHTKGPLAEKTAMEMLKPQFASLSECSQDKQATSPASVVLLLEPHVFYNAQLQVFYTEWIAAAYTSTGAPITHIRQEATQLGMLSNNPDYFIAEGYKKAMAKVIEALSRDPAFLSALDKNTPIQTSEICNALDNLTLNNLYY